MRRVRLFNQGSSFDAELPWSLYEISPQREWVRGRFLVPWLP